MMPNQRHNVRWSNAAVAAALFDECLGETTSASSTRGASVPPLLWCKDLRVETFKTIDAGISVLRRFLMPQASS